MSYFKQYTLQVCIALTLSLSAAVTSHAGFSISGKQLLDGNGNNFIMRGVNHPHTWYLGETSSFANIAATGANTVRVVLSTGGRWTRNNGADVANVISLCKTNKLVCVLEVHDSTGYTEQSGSTPISDAVNYWISADILPVIQGEEDYVIINIANEPYGNNASQSQYVDGTIGAIQQLRNAGLTHTLMIDAANWGQDWQFFMRDNAPQIFAADSLSNTLFDVHMYEVFKTAATQQAYVQAFQTHNLPLVIGEFGPVHNGQNIDIDSLLSLANQFGIGYMGWSWSGNGGCCVALDLVNGFNPGSLTSWGTRLIDGAGGIRQTSVLASVYGGSGGVNLAPIAAFTSTANELSVTFSNTSSDPDGGPQPLNFNWNFGDGQTSTDMNPVHTYAAAGTYDVILNVSDGDDTRSATDTLTVSSGSGGGNSNCEYVIQNEWNSGFVAEIRITNTGTTTISGWQVSWAYTDGSAISNGWNSNLTGSGSGPYTASNLSWNSQITPGQTVTFGFQGTHNGATSAVPVTGDVCN